MLEDLKELLCHVSVYWPTESCKNVLGRSSRIEVEQESLQPAGLARIHAAGTPIVHVRQLLWNRSPLLFEALEPYRRGGAPPEVISCVATRARNLHAFPDGERRRAELPSQGIGARVRPEDGRPVADGEEGADWPIVVLVPH